MSGRDDTLNLYPMFSDPPYPPFLYSPFNVIDSSSICDKYNSIEFSPVTIAFALRYIIELGVMGGYLRT